MIISNQGCEDSLDREDLAGLITMLPKILPLENRWCPDGFEDSTFFNPFPSEFHQYDEDTVIEIDIEC